MTGESVARFPAYEPLRQFSVDWMYKPTKNGAASTSGW
jgi:hypothetical protein